jgi:geranylgeranyl pyrophosphate synthase
LNLAYDLLDSGGKRWRPVLGMMFADCFGRNIKESMKNGNIIDENGDILYACALTEIIHNGSLMADDLEDKSLMRRGKPCTYIQYGEDYAVNTSTLMYIAPIIKLKTYIKDADKQQRF